MNGTRTLALLPGPGIGPRADFRYVEPEPENFGAFSIEYARLLLSACSEIDVVCKVLCKTVNLDAPAQNIDDYRKVLVGAFPKFSSLLVLVPRFSLTAKPWEEWGIEANPQWWRDHNKVKHARHENFKLANLQLTVTATGALFALLTYLYPKDLYAHALTPKSQVFRLQKQPSTLVTGRYELPDFPYPPP